MATASAMYHSGTNPYGRVVRDGESVYIPKGARQRRLHKAFLRYHDANNWPLLREALRDMGREDLIGNGRKHLIPTYQPKGTGGGQSGRQRPFRTQHARSEQGDGARGERKQGKGGKANTRAAARAAQLTQLAFFGGPALVCRVPGGILGPIRGRTPIVAKHQLPHGAAPDRAVTPGGFAQE